MTRGTGGRALLLTRLPGGLESLDATNRVRIAQIQDVQLERAEDLLKGILLYGELSRAGNSRGEMILLPSSSVQLARGICIKLNEAKA